MEVEELTNISGMSGRKKAYGEHPVKGIKLLRESKRIKFILTPKSVQKVLDSLDQKTFESSKAYLIKLFMWNVKKK